MYYPPAWGVFGFFSFILIICVAIPSASAITYDLDSRDVYLGISITVATLVYGILFYAICTRYLVKLEESYFEHGLSLKPVINAPTKEVRRMQKGTFMMLNEMEGIRMEMVGLNQRLKDLRKQVEEKEKKKGKAQ